MRTGSSDIRSSLPDAWILGTPQVQSKEQWERSRRGLADLTMLGRRTFGRTELGNQHDLRKADADGTGRV